MDGVTERTILHNFNKVPRDSKTNKKKIKGDGENKFNLLQITG